jgi:hypothetical protein
VGRAALDGYLARVGAVSAEEYSAWPRAEQIAYLLNAYNAYALETIIDHYPIEPSILSRVIAPGRLFQPANSIQQIPGALGGIAHRVAGVEPTLSQIADELLRSFGEPRVHFALAPAALSAPPLRGEAYVGARLEEQLDDQVRRFLNDPRHNRFEVERGRVRFSKIFEWHGEDFRPFAAGAPLRGNEAAAGALAFAARYLPTRVATFLASGALRVDFLDYDWTLNDQAVAAER